MVKPTNHSISNVRHTDKVDIHRLIAGFTLREIGPYIVTEFP